MSASSQTHACATVGSETRHPKILRRTRQLYGQAQRSLHRNTCRVKHTSSKLEHTCQRRTRHIPVRLWEVKHATPKSCDAHAALWPSAKQPTTQHMPGQIHKHQFKLEHTCQRRTRHMPVRLWEVKHAAPSSCDAHASFMAKRKAAHNATHAKSTPGHTHKRQT